MARSETDHNFIILIMIPTSNATLRLAALWMSVRTSLRAFDAKNLNLYILIKERRNGALLLIHILLDTYHIPCYI